MAKAAVGDVCAVCGGRETKGMAMTDSSDARAVAPEERDAYLRFDDWAGCRETYVVVIGETPKRYRIRAAMRTRLAGRNRWLEQGATALVPKRAIRFKELR